MNNGTTKHKCDNCGLILFVDGNAVIDGYEKIGGAFEDADNPIGDDFSLSEIHELHGRLEAGGIVPSGECPACGALCYLVAESAPVVFPATRPVCDECGSIDVVYDAWAGWNPDTDCFSDVEDTFNNAFCKACDGEAETIRVEYNEDYEAEGVYPVHGEDEEEVTCQNCGCDVPRSSVNVVEEGTDDEFFECQEDCDNLPTECLDCASRFDGGVDAGVVCPVCRRGTVTYQQRVTFL